MIDKEQRWQEIQEDTRQWVTDGKPLTIAKYALGSGKTTNPPLASDRYTSLFHNHDKAFEFREDEPTPNDHFHFRGGQQPRHDCCLRARVTANEDETPSCPNHGHPSDWPRMNPIYERPESDPLRNRFEKLSKVEGIRKAHDILELGETPWRNQFDGLGEDDHIVGVHEHLMTDEIRENHNVFIDEEFRMPGTSTEYSSEDIGRAADKLETLDFPEIAEYVDELHDEIRRGGELPEANFDPEHLAEAKVAFNRDIRDSIELGIEDSTPVCFDAIAASLGEADVIGVPNTLANCPHCDAPTRLVASTTHCTDCFWREDRCQLVTGTPPRASAWIIESSPDETPKLEYREMPPELPTEVMLLNGTANREVVAAKFNVPVDEVIVIGDEDVDPNLEVIQVMDGQYHPGTIEKTPSLQQKMQQAINIVAERHERPLIGAKGTTFDYFDTPDNAETVGYGAQAGRNFEQCDATVAVGVLHPPPALQREAEVLTQNHPTLEAGGEEYSNRDDSPNPPMTRHGNPVKGFSGVTGALFKQSHADELMQLAHRTRPILSEKPKHLYLLTNVPTGLPTEEVTFNELVGRIAAQVGVPDAALDLLELMAGIEEIDGFRTETILDTSGDEVTFDKMGLGRLAQFGGVKTREGDYPGKSTINRWVNNFESLGLLSAGDYVQYQGVEYEASLSTLGLALDVLSSNSSGKVDAVRGFCARLRNGDVSDNWLRWAARKFVPDRADPPPSMKQISTG